MSACACEMEARDARERRTLVVVLGINAAMFVAEFALGWVAQSTGLIADSWTCWPTPRCTESPCTPWGGALP